MDIIPEAEISSFAPCVQCGRCSAGCPVAFDSPHTPRKVIRFLQLGFPQEAARSPFPWFCALCQACSVRCPRGVDVAEIMLGLRRLGQRQGLIDRPRELTFYGIFTKMAQGGRISETRLGLKLALALNRRPSQLLADALLFITLWRKGKIR